MLSKSNEEVLSSSPRHSTSAPMNTAAVSRIAAASSPFRRHIPKTDPPIINNLFFDMSLSRAEFRQHSQKAGVLAFYVTVR